MHYLLSHVNFYQASAPCGSDMKGYSHRYRTPQRNRLLCFWDLPWDMNFTGGWLLLIDQHPAFTTQVHQSLVLTVFPLTPIFITAIPSVLLFPHPLLQSLMSLVIFKHQTIQPATPTSHSHSHSHVSHRRRRHLIT